MEEWYRCPYCNQKLFAYDPNTAHADGIKIKCKGRDCKKIVKVKIEKKDSLYNVTIQTKDNLYYEYKGLEAINCSLYQYLYTEEVIGNAIFIDDFYQYRIKIYDENGVYEY